MDQWNREVNKSLLPSRFDFIPVIQCLKSSQLTFLGFSFIPPYSIDLKSDSIIPLRHGPFICWSRCRLTVVCERVSADVPKCLWYLVSLWHMEDQFKWAVMICGMILQDGRLNPILVYLAWLCKIEVQIQQSVLIFGMIVEDGRLTKAEDSEDSTDST